MGSQIGACAVAHRDFGAAFDFAVLTTGFTQFSIVSHVSCNKCMTSCMYGWHTGMWGNHPDGEEHWEPEEGYPRQREPNEGRPDPSWEQDIQTRCRAMQRPCAIQVSLFFPRFNILPTAFQVSLTVASNTKRSSLEVTGNFISNRQVGISQPTTPSHLHLHRKYDLSRLMINTQV